MQYNIHEIVSSFTVDDDRIHLNMIVDKTGSKCFPIKIFGRLYTLRFDANMDEDKLNGLMQSYIAFWHERLSRNIILPILQKDDIFIDVGAAHGSWTLPACAFGAKVISIDPDIEQLTILRQQLDYNGFQSQVKIIDKPVGISPMLRVDDIDVDGVKLIKIDTEGTELDILTGAIKTIKKYRPNILVELHTFINNIKVGDEIEFVKNIIPEYRVVFTSNTMVSGGKEQYYHIYHYL